LRVDPRHSDLSAQRRRRSAKSRNRQLPILLEITVLQPLLQFSYSIIGIASMTLHPREGARLRGTRTLSRDFWQ